MPSIKNSVSMGYTISKALKKRTTLYATGPIAVAGKDECHVDVTMDGKKYRVTIYEFEEQAEADNVIIAKHRRCRDGWCAHGHTDFCPATTGDPQFTYRKKNEADLARGKSW